MSKTYVPAEMRRLVAERAEQSCEYCGINDLFAGLAFTIDHIISEVHGGETSAENLAYACAVCNHLKHANLAGYLPELKKAFILFHPRDDKWADHFSLLKSGLIECLTLRGRATARLLTLNSDANIEERKLQISLGILSVTSKA